MFNEYDIMYLNSNAIEIVNNLGKFQFQKINVDDIELAKKSLNQLNDLLNELY